MNQGAWYSSQHHMIRVIQRHWPEVQLTYVGRPATAAPAAGFLALHHQRQKMLIDQALSVEQSEHDH